MIDQPHDDVFPPADDRPIMLRAVDREDSAQELQILLSDQIREIKADATLLATIITRDWPGDPLRARRRAEERIRNMSEAISLAENTKERLTRALRSAGRL